MIVDEGCRAVVGVDVGELVVVAWIDLLSSIFHSRFDKISQSRRALSVKTPMRPPSRISRMRLAAVTMTRSRDAAPG